MPKIMLNTETNLTGTNDIVTGASDLSSPNNTVNSLIVTSGIWHLYPLTNFGGVPWTVSHDGGPDNDGMYMQPSDWGGNSSVNSVRPAPPTLTMGVLYTSSLRGSLMLFQEGGVLKVSEERFTDLGKRYNVDEYLTGTWSLSNDGFTVTVAWETQGKNIVKFKYTLSYANGAWTGKWGTTDITLVTTLKPASWTQWKSISSTPTDGLGILVVEFLANNVLSVYFEDGSYATAASWKQDNHDYLVSMAFDDTNSNSWEFWGFYGRGGNLQMIGVKNGDLTTHSSRTFVPVTQ